MELNNGVGWNKSLVVMILVKSAKLLYSCQQDLLVQGRYLIMIFYFISIFLSSNQKKNILKSCSFGVGWNFLYIFLLFSHKISKVLKLSAINKYHLTWGIYTSHSFLKIENFIVSKLLKKVLLSDSVILAMWSVKYHFTEVMTTNLETIFDFFLDNLCSISDTKVFKYFESHFLMLHHFEKDPECIEQGEVDINPYKWKFLTHNLEVVTCETLFE